MTVIPLILFATSASEAAPTASAGDLPGDINADGKLNLRDVVILYHHIAGENVVTEQKHNGG